MATVTFTAAERTELTTYLNISGGSTDAQIQAALEAQRGKPLVGLVATSPECPCCRRQLPNQKRGVGATGAALST
jgi:hypothetical protein